MHFLGVSEMFQNLLLFVCDNCSDLVPIVETPYEQRLKSAIEVK